jgi:flagellin
MRINHNIAALNTYRQLNSNQVLGNKSLEKLSSGLRITRAGDDAAGLAISEKMRGQIRGLDQATRNAQDGISLLQTAEGALNETHSILQRMRELAVQSANDTNTELDRAELQKEVDQLAQEITRIGNTTEFNTMKLLNGELKNKFHIGANESQNIELGINDMRGFKLGMVGNATIDQTVSGTNTSGGFASGATYTVAKQGTNYVLLDSQGTKIASGGTSGEEFKSTTTTSDNFKFGSALKVGSTVTISDDGKKATGTLDINNTFLEAGIYTYDGDENGGNLLDAQGNVVATSTDGKKFTILNGTDEIIIGSISLTSGASTTITVGGIDISAQSTANSAITSIDEAIQTVSAERAKLGAFQNRLEHTINNLGTASENLTAAESRIRDVDMAAEMMEFTKMNILSQAATAMLAQANMQPQMVLQLLG